MSSGINHVYIHEPNWMKIGIKANIMKTQILKYDLRCHWRSHIDILLFKNPLLLRYLFCLKSDLIKIWYEC